MTAKFFEKLELKAGGKPSTWFPPGGTRRAGCFTLNFFIDHTHSRPTGTSDRPPYSPTTSQPTVQSTPDWSKSIQRGLCPIGLSDLIPSASHPSPSRSFLSPPAACATEMASPTGHFRSFWPSVVPNGVKWSQMGSKSNYIITTPDRWNKNQTTSHHSYVARILINSDFANLRVSHSCTLQKRRRFILECMESNLICNSNS